MKNNVILMSQLNKMIPLNYLKLHKNVFSVKELTTLYLENNLKKITFVY
jgi:hypothetical protein